MTNCDDDGRLRAYLDGELPAIEYTRIAAHIAGCAHCHGRLAALRTTAARTRALLPPAAVPPEPRAALQAALARLPARDPGARSAPPLPRSDHMPVPHTVWQSRRAIFAGLATVLVLASLLVLPPVRAAADALLSVFRVQRIVFVPVDPARIAQLQELQFNPGTLFVGKPSSTGDISRTVASAAEAAAATGRAVGQPASLPAAPQLSEFRLDGGGQVQFQINTAGARQLLDALDIRDISIPDTLGAAPVMIDMPVYVSAHYRGAGYDLTLHQGPSPNVTLPDGVELAQLGKAALRVLGMTPEQAELASRQINWNTTLLFPFPADTTSVRQVTVGGEQALLVSGGARRSLHGQLYWQHGDQLYMLQASGTGITAEADLVNMLLSTAESVR